MSLSLLFKCECLADNLALLMECSPITYNTKQVWWCMPVSPVLRGCTGMVVLACYPSTQGVHRYDGACLSSQHSGGTQVWWCMPAVPTLRVHSYRGACLSSQHLGGAQVWWCMPVVPALRVHRYGHLHPHSEFQGCTRNPISKQQFSSAFL